MRTQHSADVRTGPGRGMPMRHPPDSSAGRAGVGSTDKAQISLLPNKSDTTDEAPDGQLIGGPDG